MGASASIESVQNLDTEGLAQLAVDSKCPKVVGKIILEQDINGPTVGELNDEIIGTLASSPIQKAQLLGAFHQLYPRARVPWGRYAWQERCTTHRGRQ